MQTINHIPELICDKGTNTLPSLYSHETHNKATRILTERRWNSPTNNEIKKIVNIKSQ